MADKDRPLAANSDGAAFGQRLRDERKRLDLTQAELASIGGINKESQSNYERAFRRPDSAYLQALAAHGVDVLYVLTGRREVRDGTATARPPVDASADGRPVEAVYVLRGHLHRVFDLSQPNRPPAEDVGAAVLRFT